LPNLIVTYQCNRSCPFCFATKGNSGISYNTEILAEQFDFLASSGRKSVNLIGGEPTQNPEFIPLLKWLSSKGIEITVFTNGIVNNLIINQLKCMDLENVRFIVNRSEADHQREVYPFFRSLGHISSLSVTLFHPQQRFGHIIKEIMKFRLSKVFRLGLALPVFDGPLSQIWLKPELYHSAASGLITFLQQSLNFGITPDFDCGFPYCFFTEEQKSFLGGNNILFSSDCGIIPDISAGYRIIPCFPLGGFSFGFQPADTWKDKEMEIEKFLKSKPRELLFEKCRECGETGQGNCSGGCLSLRLTKPAQLFQHT
jgi:sulfatase maturation enzyme AslB (radical SAM superfamily)